MIVASLLLIVVAVALLMLGLVDGANGYLVGSIVASLLASLALIVGGRQYAARRATAGGTAPPTGGPGGPTARPGRTTPEGPLPDGDLADEPAAQATSAGDSARVARLGAEVVVVAGRPRYHLEECIHLHGRSTTRLSARAAVEQGFTPCALCEPDTALLATRVARRASGAGG